MTTMYDHRPPRPRPAVGPPDEQTEIYGFYINSNFRYE